MVCVRRKYHVRAVFREKEGDNGLDKLQKHTKEVYGDKRVLSKKYAKVDRNICAACGACTKECPK